MRRLARVALAGAGGDRRQQVVLLAAAAAVGLLGLLNAWSAPLLHAADEMNHVDYAYQLWHGDLPVFEEGVAISPGFGRVPAKQWVGHHPPLYHLLLAPLVGPLYDAGYAEAGVQAARGFGVGVGMLVVLAASWAARCAFPARPALPAVTALVVSVAPWVGKHAGWVHNDLLALLLVTLLIGAACLAIRRGLTWPRAIALALLSTACVSTRLATSLAVVILVAAVLTCAVTRLARGHRPSSRGQTLGPIVGLAIGGPTLAAACVGWFYLRNLRLTGSLSGNQLEWAIEALGRRPRPYVEVLLDLDVTVRLLSLWSNGIFPPAIAVLALVLLPAGVGCVRGLSALRRSARLEDLLVAGGIGLVVVSLLLAQVGYAAGGGGVTPRYLLPAVTALAIGIGSGLLGRQRWRPHLVGLWCLVPMLDTGAWLARLTAEPEWTGSVPPGVCWALWGLAVLLVVVGAALVPRSDDRAPAAASSGASPVTGTATPASTPAPGRAREP